MNLKAFLILWVSLATLIFAQKSGKELASEFEISASSRVSSQWENIFSYERKMKRYGVNKLSEDEKKRLKEYLIRHAADSDHPEAAGI